MASGAGNPVSLGEDMDKRATLEPAAALARRGVTGAMRPLARRSECAALERII